MPIVVITGASRGIGLATTRVFMREGWRVIGTTNTSVIPIIHPCLAPIKLDLASAKSIQGAGQTIAAFSNGRIDVLVNNAAAVLDAHDDTVLPDKVRESLEIDLLGPIELTSYLLPLLGSGSHVVNIGSQYGSFSFPIDSEGSAGYRIAKAGLNMYTRILARQLAERGIVVSSLDPGWVKTDMGWDVATATEQPSRDPSEPAEEIFRLVTTVGLADTDCFWKQGQKREW